uniref:Metallo-beta-lactamase domain-containing protein 1 n=1 Tax=Syphacia muris TaxID=451379 RepID=A0A0N5AVX5_9BILA
MAKQLLTKGEHFLIRSSAVTGIEAIDKSDLESLGKFDLKFLKDFVHRRGKGFVSRVPLNEFSGEETKSLDTTGNEMISINGQVSPYTSTSTMTFSSRSKPSPMSYSIKNTGFLQNSEASTDQMMQYNSKNNTVNNPKEYVPNISTFYNENDYEFIATITLIVDNNKSIIVDTGLATDPEIKQLFEQGLTKYGLKASDVSIVINTHGHPAHTGNNNIFMNADQYSSVFQYKRRRFKLSQLFEDEVENLTPNVFLKRTPGHTSEDISIIVKNTEYYGTVVISGDIFMREEDTKYPMMWKPLSNNATEQIESRRRLLCLADNIIPGHGPMFPVTGEMKLQQGCDPAKSIKFQSIQIENNS